MSGLSSGVSTAAAMEVAIAVYAAGAFICVLVLVVAIAAEVAVEGKEALQAFREGLYLDHCGSASYGVIAVRD